MSPRIRRGMLLLWTLTLLASHTGCRDPIGLSTPRQQQVVGLLRIRRSEVDRNQGSPNDQIIYRETQAALLKSPFVLGSALRGNEIRGLPILKPHADRPVAWLEDSLQVELIPNSELLRVSLPLPEMASQAEITQAEKLLGAVVDAYLSEIVVKERLEHVGSLEKTRQRYRRIYDTLKKKSDEVAALKTQLGLAPAAERDRRMRQLDRLDARRLDLELQAIQVGAVGTGTEKEVTEAQLKHVQDLHEKKLDGFRQLVDASGEVEVREVEIRHLRDDAKAVRREMQKLEIRLEAHAPVQVIQPPTWISP